MKKLAKGQTELYICASNLVLVTKKEDNGNNLSNMITVLSIDFLSHLPLANTLLWKLLTKGEKKKICVYQGGEEIYYEWRGIKNLMQSLRGSKLINLIGAFKCA